MSAKKESVGQTLLVALAVSLICSVVVSTAAVMLKPVQDRNAALDRKANILMSAGLYNKDEGGDVEAIYKSMVRPRVVDLRTGDYAEMDPEQYDQYKEAKDPSRNKMLGEKEDLAGIKAIAHFSVVYEVYEDEQLKLVVLPVHGKGLWSTLYGYIAVQSDVNTVEGLGFYAHKETPGLGGEVDNPAWRALWKGKKLRDQDGLLRIEVIKGLVDTSRPGASFQVDGLSGATITSRGVSHLVQFWMGEHGFSNYLNKLKERLKDHG